MPIYEYECDGCHTVFEVRQKVSDPAPTEHSCGSKEVRRILSATSFVLKGTGWYATDYGNRKTPEPSAGADKKDAGTASGAAQKDAPAPAAKAEGSTSSTQSSESGAKASSATKASTS